MNKEERISFISSLAHSFFDYYGKQGPDIPRKENDFSSSLKNKWDIRSLVLPFEYEEAYYLFNLDLFSGNLELTGINSMVNNPEIQKPARLQSLFFGKQYQIKNIINIDAEKYITMGKKGFGVTGAVDYTVFGAFPDYTFYLQYTPLQLTMEIKIIGLSPIKWWFRLNTMVVDYSIFGDVMGKLTIGDNKFDVKGRGVLETAFGNNIAIIPKLFKLPLNQYFYIVGMITGEGILVLNGFHTVRKDYLSFSNGVFIDQQGNHHLINDWSIEFLNEIEIENQDKTLIKYPSRWKIKAFGPTLDITLLNTKSWNPVISTNRLIHGVSKLEANIIVNNRIPMKTNGILWMRYLHQGN